tara:strand:+ start:370 stop:603 length:234 start_codon:yes stop_codon:yes gene_type:complete
MKNSILNNPEYDEQVMQQIASESETFRHLLEGMVKDTDSELPTNEAWLGTLSLGKKKAHTQIKLVVTQETKNLIDEN